MRIASITALIGLASLPFLMTASPASAAGAANAPGRGVKPFPGAKAVDQSTRAFDEYWMPLGRLTGEAQAEKVETLGGKWNHITYTTPAGRSVAEVFRHYEQQVAAAGLEVVYTCKGIECGEGGRKSNGDWWALSDHRRFMAARLQRPGGDLWVSVHVHARDANAPVQHELDVIEVKPPAIAPPARNESDAATLAKELKADDRVVLHSLAFVEGKPTLMPASAGVMQAIADLLNRDPSLKLHVVVHSDDAMPAPASLDLTKRRASAVAQTLVRQYRIAPARVQPAGVGPLAPIASNRTPEGRAMNRRVELVTNQVTGGQAAASVRR
jgi:outer membrane protein OmpA-like peptidoglycan-associated protein